MLNSHNPCSDCGGKCCKNGSIFVTRHEYNKLVNDVNKEQILAFKSSYVINASPCPYLDHDKCSLGNKRFLDCKMFPWTINDKLVLELSKECKHSESFGLLCNQSKAYDLIRDAFCNDEIKMNELSILGSMIYKIDKDK